MKNYWTISIACLFISTTAFAQNDYFTVEEEGVKYPINERLKRHQVNGAAIAVVRNFEIDTAFQMGVRDAKNKLPVDDKTLFQMGSMTSPLAKFAIMRLVNDGKIDLDTDANRYLKNWTIEGKSFLKNEPITVRDLLLNRRGFNPVYKPTGYDSNEPLPTLTQILNGEKTSNLPALKLEKSKAKKSSIANILILQMILEDMHQQDFATIIKEQVFEPLGMKNSIIAANIQDENAAKGYLEEGEAVAGGHRIYPELAHSGLWSTPVDYAKFVLHIFKAAKGMDNTFLSQNLAKQGITAQEDYHALILLEKENGSYWGGAPKGFYAQFAGNVEEGWVVVGCANRELAWQFINWELNGRGIEYAKR